MIRFTNKKILPKAAGHLLIIPVITSCIFFSHPAISKAEGNKNNRIAMKVHSNRQQITGTVREDNNTTLPGVSITVKGSGTGTTTNLEGNYSINAETGSTLVFTMIGFATKEVVVGTQSVINVKMSSSRTQLDEVMVVGYGSKNKSTFAGSAVTLNAADLNQSSLSISNLLQGRAAGVQVTQNNGTPGASLSVRVRGTNSLNADSEPLYVIDGFPVADQVGFSINPDDVASITILKDAASASIYGSRGANGVILITTKSGVNKKSSLSAHSYTGFQDVVNRFELMNGHQNALRINAISEEAGATIPYSAGRLDSLQKGILGTNWQDQLFRTARVQNHNLSFEGGNQKTNIFSSFDYLDQQGIIVHSAFKRVGGRVNLNHQVSEKISMSAHVFGNYGTQNDLPLNPSSVNGFIKQVLKANPASTFDSGVSPVRDAQNPMHFFEAVKRGNSTYRTNAYFSVQYEPIKNLVFKTDLGGDMSRTEQLYFAPSTVPSAMGSKGLGTITNMDERDLIINPTVNYTIKNGSHNLKTLLGYNGQKTTYKEVGIIATDFPGDELGYDNLAIAGNHNGYSVRASPIKRKSWFGRMDYDYKGKYIFTGSYRIDGSSVFGLNHKLGYFPSASVAWNFNEESFIKNSGIFTSGKLRASYGVTGNDRIPGNLSLSNFAGDNSTKYTFDGATTVNGLAISKRANANLKWEETNALDLGLDFGILNNRIIIEADYYEKHTNDLLLARSTAPSTGFTTFFGNAGEATNKGYELFLQTTNIRGKGFSWKSTLSYGSNKNKVTSLGKEDVDIPVASFKPDGAAAFEAPFIIRVGEPIGSIYGYVYDGIIQANDPVLTTTQPNSVVGEPKFVDVNKDGIVSADDRIVLGVGVPKVNFGFTNSFSYKGFELDIVMQGQRGGDLLNVQKADMLNPIALGNGMAQIATDTWSPTNTSGTLPVHGFYGNPHGGWVNSRFVESSDYLKLKNVTLGYTIPERLTKRFGVSVLHVYMNAQNLYTWTNYSGLDPEIGNLVDNSQQNKNVARGIDFNAYPMSKMYLFGAKLTL